MIILQGKIFSKANEFPVEECVYTFHHSLSNEQISSRTMVPQNRLCLTISCMHVCMYVWLWTDLRKISPLSSTWY